ncbi:pentapeptide repeat-containing protein [Dongia sp. agr-C8]
MTVRYLAVAILVLTGFCSSAMACSVPTQVYAEDPVTGEVYEIPPSTAPPPTPEQIADSLPEVVLEGVVVQREPIAGEPGATDSHWRKARMRMDRVWKGEAAEFITLEFGEPGSMCEAVPPVGAPLRIAPTPRSPNVFGYDMLSYFGSRGPNEDAGLQLYRERTLILQRQAEAGGRAEQLAFAGYLRQHGEKHRALWMLEALSREDPNDFDTAFALVALQTETGNTNDAEDTLTGMRKIAGNNEVLRGKIARTLFETTGHLDSDWKDWSNLTNRGICSGYGQHYDDFNFAGSHLNCYFERSTFRGTNFKGSDLSSVVLEDVDLTGAKYDCATKLPKDLDPVAAAMINVDGSCPQPAPQ